MVQAYIKSSIELVHLIIHYSALINVATVQYSKAFFFFYHVVYNLNNYMCDLLQETKHLI